MRGACAEIKCMAVRQSYLPLKVNQAGMIPLIFAISVLLFPQFLAQIVAIFSATWGVTVSNFATAFVANQLVYGIVLLLARVYVHVFLYRDHVQS